MCKRMGISRTGFLVGVIALMACSSATTEEEDGIYTPSADDSALKGGDPPGNPDPLEDSSTKCGKEPALLSPVGLTFVFHVSKDPENAAREVKHLGNMRAYVRDRDVFMIEHGSSAVQKLRALFPCNRVHYIAYPDEMNHALSTGDAVDGIAVDWEGDSVDSHSLGWSVDRLHEYVHDIHAKGKRAGFVPSWHYNQSDAFALKASNMDYAIAQIQGSCVHGAQNFGVYARSIAKDFAQPRNVGFEISMDSYDVANNHVSAHRAADCTREAYGKGARAIYIYGNGHDQLPDYFHRLRQLGLRVPR